MKKIVSSFLAFEDKVDIDSYVHDIRSEAIKRFESEGFPTKKLEAWKYTSLKSLLNIDYNLFCLLYTSPSPRDATLSRMPSSA